ncbi:MAG: efflux RND transporter periplasmic adaptor subunit [Gammaproteobacteria bacterium]|nr:efflux RND transporter periplasmic adaptor subunit [Gammaproteobacteria bacterium]
MKTLFSPMIVFTLLLLSHQWVKADTVESEQAKLQQVSTTYMLEGVVQAEQNTTISAQTAGNVQKIHFDVNDFVQKNEVVVEIDNKQQASSMKQAEAALKEAKARRQEAQAEFNRVEKVYREKVVSKSEFDKASAALKAAKARVESAQAAMAKARQEFEYTLVRAPFSGILTNRQVEPGEAVNVGTQLVTGVSLEKLRVLTYVPQTILKAVRYHRYAIIVTDDSEIISTDMTFFPFADPKSHSFALRVRLPDTYNELLPGMHVKIAMEVAKEDKVVIPFSSVAFRGEVTGVYVDQGDKLQFRHIRLGRRLANNEVVVVSGVEAGESIVTDPVSAAIAIKQESAD